MINVLSLINGELIIGEVEFDNGVYKVTNPYYVLDAVTADGEFGSQLLNVLTFAKNCDITISQDKVLFVFETNDMINTYYQTVVQKNKEAKDKIQESWADLLNLVKPPKNTKLN